MLSIVETQAVQIVQPTKNHSVELKIDVLEKILNAESVRDRNVVIVSVAEALRQGKSFLLSFYLQYLNARVSRSVNCFDLFVLKLVLFLININMYLFHLVQAK